MSLAGGIIALGTCVAKRPIDEMHDIYKHRAKEIWLPHKTNVVLAGVAVNGGGKYDASGLEQILKSHSRHEDGRDMRLDDDARGEDYPRVFVVAVEVSRSTVHTQPSTAAACDVVGVYLDSRLRL